jgi:hypothetical protein
VEYEILRWPFRQWGADLVISGHDQIYQRRYIDGLTYITCGCARAAFAPIPIKYSEALKSLRVPGYLNIRPSAFALDVTFNDLNHNPLDGITIYP